MNDETKRHLQGTLFSSTSAFDQPYPVDIITPAPRQASPPPRSAQLTKIADLVQEAYDLLGVDDMGAEAEDARELLETALALAQTNA